MWNVGYCNGYGGAAPGMEVPVRTVFAASDCASCLFAPSPISPPPQLRTGRRRGRRPPRTPCSTSVSLPSRPSPRTAMREENCKKGQDEGLEFTRRLGRGIILNGSTSAHGLRIQLAHCSLVASLLAPHLPLTSSIAVIKALMNSPNTTPLISSPLPPLPQRARPTPLEPYTDRNLSTSKSEPNTSSIPSPRRIIWDGRSEERGEERRVVSCYALVVYGWSCLQFLLLLSLRPPAAHLLPRHHTITVNINNLENPYPRLDLPLR